MFPPYRVFLLIHSSKDHSLLHKGDDVEYSSILFIIPSEVIYNQLSFSTRLYSSFPLFLPYMQRQYAVTTACHSQTAPPRTRDGSPWTMRASCELLRGCCAQRTQIQKRREKNGAEESVPARWTVAQMTTSQWSFACMFMTYFLPY